MSRSLDLDIMRPLTRLGLALGVIALVAAGCAGPRQAALPQAELDRLGRMVEQADRASPGAARDLRHGWEDDLRRLQAQGKPTPQQAQARANLEFAIAYAFEREEQFREAVGAYGQLARTPLAAPASFRMGEISILGLRDRKQAIKDYSGAAMAPAQAKLWLRTVPASARPRIQGGIEWPSVLASAAGARLETAPAMLSAQMRLDLLQRDDWRYKAISAFVSLLGNNPKFSHGLALLLIAVIVKLVTTPLTSSSFRSIRAMQSLQPLIKELQEKHKGDRQALAAEQMRLFKKYKINPLGGCLPMLIQMPILIGVYQGIRFYIYQLSKARFLWISNLALADTPLLLMYAVSLYVSQKLTTMPQADPQQQQMQNMMTIMMPLMLTVLFASLPSAFILYWFAYNILVTAHQWYMMRQPLPSLAAGKEPSEGLAKARPRRRRRK